MTHIVNSEQWWDEVSLKYEECGDLRERPEEYTTFGNLVSYKAKVLEIGSAYGMFSRYIPVDCEYTGWDISMKLINKAYELNPHTYVRKDIALYSPCAEDAQKFDYTVCFQTLEHFNKAIFVNVMHKIKFLTKKELLFSVPKGKPSAERMKAEGHLIGWDDEKELIADFVKFGKVTIIEGDETHICGVVNYE